MNAAISMLLLGIAIGLWIGRHIYVQQIKDEMALTFSLEKRAQELASALEQGRAQEHE